MPLNEDQPKISAAKPWLAVACVWLLVEAPTVLAPDRIALGALRPTGDVLLLLTIAALSYRVRFGRALRWLAATVAVVLLVVRIDRSAFFVVSRAEPLLYDQLFMLRHLFVMLSDIWGLHAVPALLGIALGATLLFFLVRRLLRRASPLLSPDHIRRTATVGAVLWAALLLATVLGPPTKRGRLVRWMLPELAENVAESRRIYRSVQRAVTDSPYRAFDRVSLSRKPDVFIFFVESYGKLMAEEPRMRPAWEASLRGTEQRLSDRGWHMASAFGTAPVSGGRSWLAVGSIFLGTTIPYEAVFHQLTDAVDRIPTLVHFFASRGYDTILLAPSDRARPGVEVRNDYGFERDVTFNQLSYRGPKIGFGVMPDQYALGYAEEHVLARETRPLFFAYQMVSSHADWSEVPTYVEDWHTLNDGEGAREEAGSHGEIGVRLARYSRGVPRFAHMGALTDVMRERYTRSILYDFKVLEDFIGRQQRDALVVVMGDHQPPIVSPETVGFEVPIHLFARDPSLLTEFVDQGFSAGLVLPADRAPAVEHAGLFSLTVRDLSRCCGDGSPMPAYFPHGTASTSP